MSAAKRGSHKFKYPSTPAGQAAYDRDRAAGKVGKRANIKNSLAEMGMAAHQQSRRSKNG